MAVTTTPSFTDTGTTVVAGATVANGATARGTIDLRSKYGAWLFIRVAWLGTTAPGTQALDILVRRTINNNGNEHPGAVVSRKTTVKNGSTITSIATNANSSAGATTQTTASAWTGIVAGDIIFIGGNAGTVTGTAEWARVSKISGTTLTVDAPFIGAHTSGDTVVNGSDCFAPMWLAGGSVYEVICDYGANAAGSSVYFEALAATYNSDSSA